jgi:hypothetical protein
LPPVIVKGKEHPEFGEPRPQAGMLFYNDEGSENGGLIFLRVVAAPDFSGDSFRKRIKKYQSSNTASAAEPALLS